MAVNKEKIAERLRIRMKKFEALVKPIIKLKYIWFENILVFLDDSPESKQSIEILIHFIKNICVNKLPRIHLATTLPHYSRTPEIEKLIIEEADKLLRETRLYLLSKVKDIEVDTTKVDASIEGLKKLKKEINPDLAIISSPYDKSEEILEDVSQYAWILWIENFTIPTIIVPCYNEGEHNMDNMFNTITILVNDWNLANEKINSALLFLNGASDNSIDIRSIEDTEIIQELQEKTEMKELHETLVEASKQRHEIFIPQLKQELRSVIGENGNIPSISHSVQEGKSLEVLSSALSENNSGLLIIGQRNIFREYTTIHRSSQKDQATGYYYRKKSLHIVLRI